MPIIDTSINKFIDDSLIEANRLRDEKHEPSGLLSASMLYQPLRFQVLKTLGAPKKEFDTYTLGKFKRGNDVEDWFVGHLRKMGVLARETNGRFMKATQVKLEYRGAIGYVDAIVDSRNMRYKDGIIPHEVKSVVNSKFKWIAKGGVDWHYKIQGCFYAMAMERPSYAIDIVSAEDLRPNIYIFHTRELKADVDKAIDAYDQAMKNWNENRILPAFEPNPKVAWTANIKYAMFDPFWVEGADELVIKKLEELKLI